MGDYKGSGQVFDGQSHIADVGYEIRSEIRSADDFGLQGQSATPSVPRMKLIVHGLPEGLSPMTKLTLVLENGQDKLNFHAMGVNNFEATGAIYR
jgi:hypothetical protein